MLLFIIHVFQNIIIFLYYKSNYFINFYTFYMFFIYFYCILVLLFFIL